MIISFSVNLSNIKVIKKLSNIRISKESYYDDLGSFTHLEMLLIYFNFLSPSFIRVIFINVLNNIDMLMFKDILVYISRIHSVINNEVIYLKYKEVFPYLLSQ